MSDMISFQKDFSLTETVFEYCSLHFSLSQITLFVC